MHIALLFFIILSTAADVLRQGRIMPPPQLKCERSDLTSYDGRILVYRRRTGSTFLRIRTNFDTTEEVTIRHRGSDDPSRFYLINGEAFTKSDWRRIERKPRVLKSGMRGSPRCTFALARPFTALQAVPITVGGLVRGR